MFRRNSRRVVVGILATGLALIAVGSSVAAVSGSYTGAGKGFAISFDVKSHHVTSLTVACHKGAVTVVADGLAPKVKHESFTYSGPASASDRTKAVKMKVTGTFSDRGKKVKGSAFTAGACPKGKYTGSK